ncbi:FtsK/SpoIIIE domain-containing protein [Methylocapsa palsarum]|uniref:FtsK/SpoIIIE domain-containing protein n=1 Tax=Methylocapsa palsarum TaxID=1612308 RepID=UPI001AEC7B00|nr:FtsK/SpoIIIE domain-containing protein [Methylocapsa palsarum]
MCYAPHTLIAGSTGSGKSVLMQNIILGIAATNTPAQAKIILIDPKQGVDYLVRARRAAHRAPRWLPCPARSSGG